MPPAEFPQVVGRISFFVNAGVRFVTEMCKLRAFAELWDQITAERYGVADPKLRRFRYGVQVNSLGLTEQQPENNVYRILLEALAVVLSKRARARAVQLPAWNEALGLPRPWDQQWSLRLQQILAYETDLLEYDDLFDGAPVVAAKVEALAGEARAELARIEAMGGALAAVESGYMKQRLVEIERAPARRDRRRHAARGRGQLLHRDGAVAACRRRRRLSSRSIPRPKPSRSSACRRIARRATMTRWLARSRACGERRARAATSWMPSIACARAGVTTGEWAETLRQVFGEYRAPTGVSGARPQIDEERLSGVRARVDRLAERLAGAPRCWSASPGSTATPTAPSRSPCAPATAASRWSTTASA